MRKFIQKALGKLDKMDREQVRGLLRRMSTENDLLETVLDSMTDGLVMSDRRHRILRYNKSFVRLMPLYEGELSEESLLWEVVSDREIARFFKEKLSSQEKVIDKEFTLENGVARVVSCSIMPLVREGAVAGNLVHVEDVTERRSKEARLRRAESLAALTTLAAGVAHEIKNPLGSISIHLQLTQKVIDGKSRIQTKDIRKYLEVISEEVDRLNRIVVDFLFTVRPMDTALTEQRINPIIEELLDFLKFELQEAGVDLVVGLARNLPRLRLDEKYVKQALLNLVKNAVSAMPDGGTLRVETEQMRDEVVLKITDTGIGIPEENMDKIFEPYFTTKDFGTGLGLTLVYKIVKEHLGDISVLTKEGDGTTFVLSFPVPQHEQRLIGYEGEAE